MMNMKQKLYNYNCLLKMGWYCDDIVHQDQNTSDIPMLGVYEVIQPLLLPWQEVPREHSRKLVMVMRL